MEIRVEAGFEIQLVGLADPGGLRPVADGHVAQLNGVVNGFDDPARNPARADLDLLFTFQLHRFYGLAHVGQIAGQKRSLGGGFLGRAGGVALDVLIERLEENPGVLAVARDGDVDGWMDGWMDGWNGWNGWNGMDGMNDDGWMIRWIRSSRAA